MRVVRSRGSLVRTTARWDAFHMRDVCMCYSFICLHLLQHAWMLLNLYLKSSGKCSFLSLQSNSTTLFRCLPLANTPQSTPYCMTWFRCVRWMSRNERNWSKTSDLHMPILEGLTMLIMNCAPTRTFSCLMYESNRLWQNHKGKTSL